MVSSSDEEDDTISKNKKIAKSVCLPPVNDLLLEVQRRLKELDEKEARLAEKEKESAVCVASAAAKAFKSVPVTAKYQSTPAEYSFPTIDRCFFYNVIVAYANCFIIFVWFFCRSNNDAFV